MGLDREMKPKRISASLIVMLIGLAIAIIGTIWWKTTDIGKYLDLKDISMTYPADGVTKVEIGVGVGELELTTGSDKIEINAISVPEGSYHIGVTDGVFTIEPIQHGFSFLDQAPLTDEYTPKIKVSIPDSLYNEFNVAVGVGKAKFNGFRTQKLTVEVGVGNAEFTNVSAENYFESEVGIGQLDFSGKVKGKMSCEVGIGDAQYNIDGYYNDYRINTKSGIGSVDISMGDTSVHGEGSIPIDASVGIGSIKLRFKR